MLTEHGRTFQAQFIEQKRAYPITWKNDDGSVIETVDVAYGDVPTHSGPIKAETNELTYTFAGWDPEPTAVVGAAAYQATFASEKRTYPITWKNDDGSVIETTDVAYGDVPTHSGPIKAETNEFTYTFAGWDPEPTAVVGAAAYQATFASEKRTYPITWKNDDGSVIETTNVAYGEVPTHNRPTKADTDEFTYAFAGWTPEIAAVTGPAEYKATFNAVKRKYKITWRDAHEALAATYEEYGKVPTPPVLAFDINPDYTVKGYSPELKAVTGDATYTVLFQEKGGTGTDPVPAPIPEPEPAQKDTKNQKSEQKTAAGSASQQTAILGLVSMGADEVKRTDAEQAERDAVINTFGDWEAVDGNGDPVVVLIGGINEPSNGITDEMKADFEALAYVLVDAGTDEASIPADLAADAADGATLAATNPFRAVASSYPATVTISLNDPDAFVGMMTFLNGKWVKLDTIVNDDGTVTFTLDQPAVLSIVSQTPDAA